MVYRGAFSGDLLLREKIGRPFFEVASDISFTRVSGAVITVPAGTRTDLFSVPKPLRSIVSAMQKSSIPAVLHDYAYREQIFGADGRAEADKLIVEAMHAVNYEAYIRGEKKVFSNYKIAKIYSGLKLGGWITYRRYKK